MSDFSKMIRDFNSSRNKQQLRLEEPVDESHKMAQEFQAKIEVELNLDTEANKELALVMK